LYREEAVAIKPTVFKLEAIDRLTSMLVSKSNQEHDAASPCVLLVSPLLLIFSWCAAACRFGLSITADVELVRMPNLVAIAMHQCWVY
jgi:hypothetical protein